MCDDSVEEFLHATLADYTSEFHPIRLLYIRPSHDYYADLNVTLQHVDLLTEPDFKALSYVWGDPNITLPIFVNGKRFTVTANCHAALLRLREIGETCLWIDAICINQKDDVEKLIHIRLMKDVYFFASEVIVWLGSSEAAPTSDVEGHEALAFDLINHLKIIPKETKYASDFRQALLLGNGGWPGVLALNRLFNHPWFQRLWVHQEAVVSKHAIIVTQHRITPLLGVLEAASVCQSFLGRKLAEELSILSGINDWVTGFRRNVIKIHARRRAFRSFKRESRKSYTSLLTVLRECQHYDCSDPRDRVLGILALLDEDVIRQIRPELGQTLQELYTATTTAIIEATSSVEVLRYCQIDISEDSLDLLPTWVVDLRHLKCLEDIKLRNRVYRAAAGERAAIYSHKNGPAILSLAGIQVDIALVSLMPIAIRDIGTLLSWQRESLMLWENSFTEYPGGANFNDVWLRMMILDLKCDPEYGAAKPGRATPDYVRYLHKGFRLLEQKAKDDERLCSLGITYAVGAESPLLPEEIEYLKVTFARTSNLAIFASKLGYIGCASKSLRAGDKICIFPGSRAPLVLRKVEDHHVLVGECYVGGIMNGEIMKEKAVEGLEGKTIEYMENEAGWTVFNIH
jgi:hypothetical protein